MTNWQKHKAQNKSEAHEKPVANSSLFRPVFQPPKPPPLALTNLETCEECTLAPEHAFSSRAEKLGIVTKELVGGHIFGVFFGIRGYIGLF